MNTVPQHKHFLLFKSFQLFLSNSNSKLQPACLVIFGTITVGLGLRVYDGTNWTLCLQLEKHITIFIFF